MHHMNIAIATLVIALLTVSRRGAPRGVIARQRAKNKAKRQP